VAVLRRGGNAVDAAVATSAVLAVTTQHMCGMGGDLFALVGLHGGERPACLDASGRAGSGASAERLRAQGYEQMPFRGHVGAVTVPGCVDGWVTLHERFGRLPLDAVLADAVHHAAEGFPVAPLLSAAIRTVEHLTGAADYAGARTGSVVRRPGVAAALAAVAEHGRDAFYLGEFGEGLVALGGGQFTQEDLRRSQADWVEPLGLDAFGRRLWTVPPASQGYLTLAAAWIADCIGVPEDPAMPAWSHLLVEAAKQAGYDRDEVLSDRADGAALLDPARLAPRRGAIDPARAAHLGAPVRGGGTIYLCAADGDGMAVSLIQSNAAGFGSHLVEPATRIFLHNRGLGFSLEAGHPAELAPGRRPPHTLSPALVTDPGGDLVAVLGAMGGDSQPQVVLQLLARLLVAGQGPGEAVAAGRWRLAPAEPGTGFDTWSDPSAIVVELEGHAAPVDAALADLGHAVRRVGAWSGGFGHAHAILLGPDGVLAGAADPRAVTGAAQGY
jgi:gamma-glutamyltranspeptidase/glutathione hydrolase